MAVVADQVDICTFKRQMTQKKKTIIMMMIDRFKFEILNYEEVRKKEKKENFWML